MPVTDEQVRLLEEMVVRLRETADKLDAHRPPGSPKLAIRAEADAIEALLAERDEYEKKLHDLRTWVDNLRDEVSDDD